MRPGELTLTKRLLSLCALSANARVLDIGCGDGQTVGFLNGKDGLEAWGIDPKPGAGKRLIIGRAEALPFETASFDVVLLECSLSVIADPDAALAEAARVLKPEGLLYIADLYAPAPAVEFSGLPWRIEKWETQVTAFARARFRVSCFEDHSAELLSMWTGLLFEGGYNSTCNLCLPRGFRGGYFLAVLEKEPFTRESLEKYRREKREEAIRRARANSPFYREHRGRFMDADTIAAQGERMLCVPLGDVARIRTLQSSGSTGVPKRVWFTERDMERTVSFFSRGMRPLVREGGTCVVMLSNDTPGSVADLLRRGLAHNGVNCVIQGKLRGTAAALETLLQAAAGAQCYVGLPAELFWLCRSAPYLRPETVLLSADYVPDSITKVLTKEWGCRVFTHYGMTETCYGLAVQCNSQGGHHIRLDDYIVEIIDPVSGEEIPPGKDGEIVLTSLNSEAMPLLRYRTGDIGSILAEPCGCGNVLPRLGKIRGRREYLKNRLNIHTLDDLIFTLPDIRGYKAALDGDALLLTLDGGAADEQDLSEKLDIKVKIQYGKVLPYDGKRELEIRS
ncbi:MAG: methyltransferase domain-containing protein [Treponema sp.]|jgi:phenylacetate-coenzyme A ligase PaaK-like adenylate-forming protein|nr:methyltransferase domain-containing protein [Treponema sp.]